MSDVYWMILENVDVQKTTRQPCLLEALQRTDSEANLDMNINAVSNMTQTFYGTQTVFSHCK